MKKVFLLLVFIGAIILLSGCTEGPNLALKVRQMPEVEAFFEKNPGATITVYEISKLRVGSLIEDIREKCGLHMQEEAYWNVYVIGGKNELEVYFDETGEHVLCLFDPTADQDQPDNTGPQPTQDECSSNSECEDNNSCTTDTCEGDPKKCVNTATTECVDEDGCCPTNCDYFTDLDCPRGNNCVENYDCDDNVPCTSDRCHSTLKTCTNTQITTCNSWIPDGCCLDRCNFANDADCSGGCTIDSDCDDDNNSTIDTCNLKTCNHTLRTCSQQGGRVCTSNQSCPQLTIPASDSNSCCKTVCTTVDPCAGITCLSDKKCVSGTCVLKTCAERSGGICGQNETCNGSIATTSDSSVCCIGNCVSGELCTAGSCTSDKKCVDGECVLKTCAERNGNICSGNYACRFDYIDVSDSDKCCSALCVESYDLSAEGPMSLGGTFDEGICSSNSLYLAVTSTAAGNETVDYRILLDGVVVKESLMVIEPGTVREVFAFGMQVLNKTVTFILDPNNEKKAEIDKTNNTLEYQFNFGQKDNYVMAANYAGNYVAYSIEVDESTADCPPVESELYVDGEKSTGHITCAVQLAGNVHRLCYANHPLSAGAHDIRIVIDPENKIAETNENNNEFTTTLQV